MKESDTCRCENHICTITLPRHCKVTTKTCSASIDRLHAFDFGYIDTMNGGRMVCF